MPTVFSICPTSYDAFETAGRRSVFCVPSRSRVPSRTGCPLRFNQTVLLSLRLFVHSDSLISLPRGIRELAARTRCLTPSFSSSSSLSPHPGSSASSRFSPQSSFLLSLHFECSSRSRSRSVRSLSSALSARLLLVRLQSPRSSPSFSTFDCSPCLASPRPLISSSLLLFLAIASENSSTHLTLRRLVPPNIEMHLLHRLLHHANTIRPLRPGIHHLIRHQPRHLLP